MAEILVPCTVSLCYSQNEDHGLKIQCNITDLCLNVALRSIQIINASVQEFLESMEHMTDKELASNSVSENQQDYSKIWEPE